jgi:uncharacterized DUF497 family protein
VSFQYVFSWDPEKARANRVKHGIAFELAATAFGDPFALSIADPLHGSKEDLRWITLGLATTGTLIVVVHTFDEIDDDGARIRLISARRATRRERQQYESG